MCQYKRFEFICGDNPLFLVSGACGDFHRHTKRKPWDYSSYKCRHASYPTPIIETDIPCWQCHKAHMDSTRQPTWSQAYSSIIMYLGEDDILLEDLLPEHQEYYESLKIESAVPEEQRFSPILDASGGLLSVGASSIDLGHRDILDMYAGFDSTSLNTGRGTKSIKSTPTESVSSLMELRKRLDNLRVSNFNSGTESSTSLYPMSNQDNNMAENSFPEVQYTRPRLQNKFQRLLRRRRNIFGLNTKTGSSTDISAGSTWPNTTESDVSSNYRVVTRHQGRESDNATTSSYETAPATHYPSSEQVGSGQSFPWRSSEKSLNKAEWTDKGGVCTRESLAQISNAQEPDDGAGVCSL